MYATVVDYWLATEQSLKYTACQMGAHLVQVLTLARCHQEGWINLNRGRITVGNLKVSFTIHAMQRSWAEALHDSAPPAFLGE